MDARDPWPPLTDHRVLLGIPTTSRFFALDPESRPISGQVGVGYLFTVLGLPFIALFLATGSPTAVVLALLWLVLVIAGLLAVRATVTIDNTMVRVSIRRLFRAPIRLEEPLAHYAGLRWRRVSHSFGTRYSISITINRHLLELAHASDPGRSVPVFWSTRFRDVAPWQSRLAAAIGVPALEIASGASEQAPPETLTHPLTTKATAPVFGAPPDGLAIASLADSVHIIMKPPENRISMAGVRVALAILALPLGAVLFLLPAVGYMLIGLLVGMPLLYMFLSELGAAPPPGPASEILLTPAGVHLLIRRWGVKRWRRVPAADILAVGVGCHESGRVVALGLRTHDQLFTAGAGLPPATLEWLRARIEAHVARGH